MAVDAGSTGGAACLATIMTEDRVLAFHRLAASWPWPISVAYLSTEWHRDRRLGLQLLDVQAQPPPDAHRIVLSVVADRGYRCARRQPRLPRSVRPIRSLSLAEPGRSLPPPKQAAAKPLSVQPAAQRSGRELCFENSPGGRRRFCARR